MASTQQRTKPPKTIEIFVNNKPVHIEDREVSGAEIKNAAGIDSSFKLYNQKGKEIANEESVRVHPKEKFTAISGQDVS